MHVVDSIRILLMLLSYVMQKTGRLTFEEKYKMLEFIGTLAKHTTFTPRISGDDTTARACIHLIEDLQRSTSRSNLNPACIDTQSTGDS